MAEAVAEPQTHAPTDWRALIVLLMGACIIGLSPIFVRLASHGPGAIGPAAAGFWRLLVALPLLALLSRQATGGVGRAKPIALWAGLFFALDLGFWHYGIRYTSVTNATVLSNLTPVVVTTFAWLFLKQRPRALFLLSVAAAVGGAWLMAIEKGGGLTNQPLGDALSALTALWYALYFLTMNEGRKTDGASRLMFWVSVVGAPLMLISALLLGEPLWPGSPLVWGACVGLGLMHVTGQGSIAWAMGRLPIATASVVVLIQPIVAAWLGWMLFAEPIGPLQALGAAVTLGGVVLAQLSSRRSA